MPQDQAKRQRRIQKQKAKRKEKRKEFLRTNSNSLISQLAKASEWPIYEVLEAEYLWEQGVGHLITARQTPEGRMAWAAFLLDVWCLGVKNVMCGIDSITEYAALRDQLESLQSMSPIRPERLAKIIRGAVAFAGDMGFMPPADFPEAFAVLAGIDPNTCYDPLEFGKDGKPLYMSGPYESPARSAAIAAKVQAYGGSVVAAAPPGSFDEPVMYDEQDDEDAGENLPIR